MKALKESLFSKVQAAEAKVYELQKAEAAYKERIAELEAALRGASGEASSLRTSLQDRRKERDEQRAKMEAFREVALAFAGAKR